MRGISYFELLTSNFLLLTSMFVLDCFMCAYGCPSVRMYLSASCVRVSMLPFVCVHARVRDCVYVSPFVRPSVCPRACSCVQMFYRTSLRSSMHAFVCLHARVLEGVRCTWVFASVRICAYVYPSVPMYLSASCVRVSILAFVFVHARVREGVCVTPSERPSVRLSVCLSACMFVRPNVDRTCVRSSMYAFVCLHARVREGICLGPSVHPSVCLSACMFVRPNVCSHMRKRIEKMIGLKRLYKS